MRTGSFSTLDPLSGLPNGTSPAVRFAVEYLRPHQSAQSTRGDAHTSRIDEPIVARITFILRSRRNGRSDGSVPASPTEFGGRLRHGSLHDSGPAGQKRHGSADARSSRRNRRKCPRSQLRWRRGQKWAVAHDQLPFRSPRYHHMRLNPPFSFFIKTKERTKQTNWVLVLNRTIRAIQQLKSGRNCSPFCRLLSMCIDIFLTTFHWIILQRLYIADFMSPYLTLSTHLHRNSDINKMEDYDNPPMAKIYTR